VTICDSEKSQILNGPWDLDTGLWRINLNQTNNHIPYPIVNNVYELRNTGALVHYLHKALFSRTKSALLQAVKDGHLITWPGLTEDAINKHLKLTPARAMVHMNQRRKNIRSALKTPIADQPAPDTDLGTKTHLVYAVVVDQGQLYTDLTENSRSDPAKETHMSVKLLPLPQPPVRARTDARTNTSAQRATQLRSVLERVYAVSRQNQITTTVP
jgi:hypothetical protein